MKADGTHGDGGEESDGDERSLAEIVNGDLETYYTRALDAGACFHYDEDEDAPAHAVAFVSNGRGERGWIVISANGHSWEGLQYETSEVFATRMEAIDHARFLVAGDELAYEERMREEAEQENEQEEVGEDE